MMAYDQKYGQVQLEHGNIGENEPVFVIRAKDVSSISAIKAYFAVAKYEFDAGFPEGAEENILSEFKAWQNENGCKVPD